MSPRSIFRQAGRLSTLLAVAAGLSAAAFAAPAAARTLIVVGEPAAPYVWHRPWGPRYTYPAPVVVAPPPPAVVYQVPPPYAAPPVAAPGPTAGPVCREYQSQVVVGDAVRPGYGTACLQPDGSWRIVD